MNMIGCIRHGLMLGAAFVPLGAVHASCPPSATAPLSIGTVMDVEPGAAQSYSLALKEGEGVIVDLTSTSSVPSDGDEAPLRNIALCDASGALLAPLPGEVFEKGGSLSTIEDGERLRFVAPADGDYLVAIKPADTRREILARNRGLGRAQSGVVAIELDNEVSGKVSSGAPKVYSFTGQAGQWVELTAVSEKDTLLRLAGPDAAGAYSVIAENDDSNGLNPMLRRRLRTGGTYFLQVDSLDDQPGDFELMLHRVPAPTPPSPPAQLRLGTEVAGRLADGDAVVLYAMPVTAGHSYRLDLTAPYDSVVAIGLPNPVEADDGDDGPEAGFSEVKSQDANLTGTERLNFTARNNGTLLVRVKSFGLDDTNGAYTLMATDLGA